MVIHGLVGLYGLFDDLYLTLLPVDAARPFIKPAYEQAVSRCGQVGVVEELL